MNFEVVEMMMSWVWHEYVSPPLIFFFLTPSLVFTYLIVSSYLLNVHTFMSIENKNHICGGVNLFIYLFRMIMPLLLGQIGPQMLSDPSLM